MAQIGVDKGNYTFDASAKTITFTGVTVDTVDQIKLVNNVTDGEILFNPIDPTKLGVLSGNVLTLTHDTTSMSDTDDLFVCVNLGLTDKPHLIFSTTTPLLASATFSSGILSLEQKSQVETTVLSDTDGTLVFDFYNDLAGTDLVRSLSIPYVGGSGFQYFAAPAFSNFVEYKFINSATPQTDFLYQTKVLTTALSGQIVRLDGNIAGGMVAPITRSILTGRDDEGVYRNARITTNRELGISIFDPETGSQTIVDLNGSLKVGTATNILGTAFGDASPSDNQWSTIGTGSGVRNDIPGAISLETGTTADSTVSFQSTTKARFVAANFNVLHIGCNINNIAATDNVRTWGAYNPQDGTTDGVWFRLDSGVMCVGYTKQNVETVIIQSNWNGASKEKFVLDTKTRVYEVQYNAGAIKFFQNGNELHTVTSFDEVYAGLYNFKLALNNENINGNTANNSIQSRALAIYRIGEERGATISRTFPTGVTVIKAGAGFVESVTLARSGGGSSGSSISIYDNTAASGTELGNIKISKDETFTLNINSTFTNGLTIDVSATGDTVATVVWE
jgi:hypothetical protein